MTMKRFRPIDDLDKFAESLNDGAEGTIRTDEFGNRWIFRNGRWKAMCYVKEIFE